MDNVDVAYIAASANRFNHAGDASSSSTVAYGSGRLIALWDAQDIYNRGVLETLPGHSSLVSCVKFVDAERFVSTDESGALKLWRYSGSKWVSVFTSQAHTKAVSALTVHLEANCLATGGSDSSVKIWKLGEQDDLQEIQSISLKGRYPLSLALATLPGSKALILAVAVTDRSLQIYTRSEVMFLPSATMHGHDDWVRSLAFCHPTSSSDPLILASGSQDATIRLWNIEHAQRSGGPTGGLSDDLFDAFEASLGDLTENDEGGRQISLKHHILTVKGDDGSPQQFSITFDALLVGHEAGVTSLSWRPFSSSSSSPTLLSTSTDSSIILWSPSSIPTGNSDASSSLWINSQRFGDVGGQRLGGFVGGLWGCEGMEVLAWGWAGGWRRWQCMPGLATAGVADEAWSEVGAISGHAGPVRGISWSPDGEYFISAGLDQTSRIHAAIPVAGLKGKMVSSWHELGRPQVHGYDLVGVAFLDALRFVSVADEKVARVFQAPRSFFHAVKALAVAELTADEEKLPISASVPPLGLSNKANNDTNPQLVTAHGDATPPRRPFEAELAAITLWPEIEKVFGHGYESITVSVSHTTKLMATACKATTPKHAVVRVYDTDKFQPVGEPLEGHALTVTRIAFSPDDQLILTVSRDRTWRLFQAQGEQGYIPVAADKSHARIIWDCAWAPDGRIFATASRDKTVKIWHPKGDSRSEWSNAATLKFPEAATAVAFAQTVGDDASRVLAIGVETGDIFVYTSSSATDWHLSLAIKTGAAHVDHIHQLAWRPGKHSEGRQLASCSEDGTLRIVTVR
ncbi:WD40 repeat-like protein [Artomyces pyxidatus]|uniref:WD40 repeat-like protein n=1 Tax=Artomyces pyxidatus TaxID=48021 RepID=A0ACB8TKS0_9AGAM|nr:WD40 repeat-like protein [Artomyces pyxidatus]